MKCKVCGHNENMHAPLHRGINSCQMCPAGKADHVFIPQTTLPRAEEFTSDPSDNGHVVTLDCKEPGCTWAAMFIFPEECFRYLIAVLGHARDVHGVKVPEMEHRTL